jgi:hypothetical protein
MARGTCGAYQGQEFMTDLWRDACLFAMHAPSIIGLRAWQGPSRKGPAYTFGGSCRSAFQSLRSTGGPGAREFLGRLLLRRPVPRLSPARQFGPDDAIFGAALRPLDVPTD